MRLRLVVIQELGIGIQGEMPLQRAAVFQRTKLRCIERRTQEISSLAMYFQAIAVSVESY